MCVGWGQARSQGGSGGSYDPPPPQLPIPKILFHPLAILFHPLAILFHLSAILFHPLAILFHPWNMWMTSHGQCPRGGACECPRVGAFFKLMTSHGQCPRGGGGAPGVPPIQVQTPPPPPHLAGWLRAWGVLVFPCVWPCLSVDPVGCAGSLSLY